MIACVAPSITGAQRIVIKIGSALVVDEKLAAPRMAWLDSVAADIHSLRDRGTDVIVVSSGAIALARRTLGLTQKRLNSKKSKLRPPSDKSASRRPGRRPCLPMTCPLRSCC